MARGGRRAGAGRPKHVQEVVGSRAQAQRGMAAIRRAARAQAPPERVIEECARVSFSDIGAIFDEAGHLRPIHTLPPAVRAAIASVKITKKNLTAGDGAQEDVVEVKLWDKLRALEMLAKHHGLLVEKVDVSGQITLEQRIAQARRRLAAARR